MLADKLKLELQLGLRGRGRGRGGNLKFEWGLVELVPPGERSPEHDGKKKTGPVCLEVAERPGEFRLVQWWAGAGCRRWTEPGYSVKFFMASGCAADGL